jgi:hypothetical protein
LSWSNCLQNCKQAAAELVAKLLAKNVKPGAAAVLCSKSCK